MTSKHQGDANRRNAKKSTGPRSKAGKAVARMNARLHGLAAPVRSEPGADAEIDALARALLDEAGREDLFALAWAVAEAEIDLRRVRRARALAANMSAKAAELSLGTASSEPVHRTIDPKLLRRLYRLANQRQKAWSGTFRGILVRAGWDPDTPPLEEAPAAETKKGSSVRDSLERYERRALSRRKTAIQAFDVARRAWYVNKLV